MMLWRGVLLMSFGMSASAYDAFDYPNPFACQNGSAWNWYCDDKPNKTPRNMPPVQAAPPATSPKEELKIDPRQQTLKDFEKLKKEVDNSLSIAYMNPTNENLKRYFELSNELKTKAAVFADAGQRFMWQNPELDYLQRYPQTDIGKRTQLAQYDVQVNQTLAEMVAQGWGILFFFKSDCPYCDQQIPILTMLQQKYRFPITPVSVDGGLIHGLENFESPLINRGQAQAFGISKTPSLLLANPQTGQTMLLSQGLQTFTELERRLYTITTKPGENF